MRVSERGRRSSSAVLIYVIILMAMQVFLVTVAAEAFLADEAGLAWATAMVLSLIHISEPTRPY